MWTGRRRCVLFVAVLLLVAPPVAGLSDRPVPDEYPSADAVDRQSTSPLPQRWNQTYGTAAGDFYGVTVGSNDTILAVGSILTGNGTSADGWVVSTTPNGTEEWTRTYGGSGDDRFHDVAPTSDGGFVLAGATTRGNDTDGWAVKIDANGTVEWRVTNGSADNDVFRSVQLTPNGNAVLAGTRGSDNIDSDGWAVGISQNGTVQWTRTYDDGFGDRFVDIERTTPEEYHLIGTTGTLQTGRTDGWLVTVDERGTEQWNRTYGGAGDDEFLAARPVDDGLVLVGATGSYGGDEQGWALTVDVFGNEQWNRTYSGEALTDVAATADGGSLVTSRVALVGPGDGLVANLSRNGTVRWRMTYGGQSYESLAGLSRVQDEEFVFAGTSGSSDGRGTGWLFTLGGQGPESERPENGSITPPNGTETPTTRNETDQPDTVTTRPASGTTTVPSQPTDPTTARTTTPRSTSSAPETTAATADTDPALWPLILVAGIILVAAAFLLWRRRTEEGQDGFFERPDPLASTDGAGTAGPSVGMEGDEATLESVDAAGAQGGTDAADGASAGGLPATEGPPGTFILSNTGSEAVICRFRCRTADAVVFTHWVELEPGQQRRAHKIPSEDVFAIAVTVEDGPADARQFLNRGPGGTDVLVQVTADTVDIQKDER